MTTGFARRRARHLRLGRRGERLARTLLQRLGLDILVTNFRCAAGEIDLVAREETTLCFVEVKTRRYRPNSRPADAVGPAKQRRIVRTAHRYLREIGRPDLPYRYDIVEIILDRWRLVEVRYWRNAFSESPRRASDVMPRVHVPPPTADSASQPLADWKHWLRREDDLRSGS